MNVKMVYLPVETVDGRSGIRSFVVNFISGNELLPDQSNTTAICHNFFVLNVALYRWPLPHGKL